MRLQTAATLFILSGLLAGCAGAGQAPRTSAVEPRAISPLEATYLIDQQPVTLSQGQAVTRQIPGAASQTLTRATGDPAYGDLDGDGVTDAAVLLVQTTGGSGTFYYVAAALNRAGRYEGTTAVFLGDRIAVESLQIGHGVVIVDYRDRRADEPMAMPPTLERSEYLLFDNQGFRKIPVAEDELIIAGEVVVGHEVRAIRPCGEPDASWLAGDSPALPTLMTAYHFVMSDAPAYTPLFMIITGRREQAPADGFGAQFPTAIRVSRVIRVSPGASCGN